MPYSSPKPWPRLKSYATYCNRIRQFQVCWHSTTKLFFRRFLLGHMHISGAIKNGSKNRILRQNFINHPIMKTQTSQPPVDKVTAKTKQGDTGDSKQYQKYSLNRAHQIGIHEYCERNKRHGKCAQGKA